MASLVAVLLFVVFLWCLHKYIAKYKLNYWNDLGVPFVKPRPFGIPRIKILTQSILELQLKLYNDFQNAKVVGLFEFWKPILMIRDPEIIKLVTVKNFDHFVDRRVFITEESRKIDPVFANALLNLQGSKWKEVRSIMTPALTTGKIKGLFETVSGSSPKMMNYLRKYSESGEELEMKELFGRLTMDVIGSSAFGIDCNTFDDSGSDIFPKMGKKFANPEKWDMLRMVIFALAPKVARFLRLKFFNEEATQFLEDAVKSTISRRKELNERRKDFLQLLLDEEKENNEEENSGHSKGKSSAGLDIDMIVSQAILFFVAGFDTTAGSLSFIAYELALNGEVQDKLREEVQEIVERHGDVTYDALQEMEYMDMVISESLRLHPAAAAMERKCTKEYTIPGTNITIQKGQMISIPSIGLHMDPEYFPDPETFDPTRFSKEEKANRNPYVYMPFGLGPRNCIGIRFAQLEMKAAIASFLLNFRFLPCDKTQIPMEYAPGISVRATKGIWLKVEQI